MSFGTRGVQGFGDFVGVQFPGSGAYATVVMRYRTICRM